MRYFIFSLCILGLSLYLTQVSFGHLREIKSEQGLLIKDEPLYLPKKSALKGLSLGYRNTLSHILWFQTVNYFGKHYRGDKVYTWLEQMCELSTAINQNAKHIYEFCGLMLAWEANRPDLAEKVFSAFIKSEPTSWRPYYLQGMNSAIFDKSGKAAKQYFIQAAQTPNAPVFLVGLASKKIAELENKDLAIAFLKSMIQQTREPSQLDTLNRKLAELQGGD